MIISTKIWKSYNYRGFILLFVHPAYDTEKAGLCFRIRPFCFYKGCQFVLLLQFHTDEHAIVGVEQLSECANSAVV